MFVRNPRPSQRTNKVMMRRGGKAKDPNEECDNMRHQHHEGRLLVKPSLNVESTETEIHAGHIRIYFYCLLLLSVTISLKHEESR